MPSSDAPFQFLRPSPLPMPSPGTGIGLAVVRKAAGKMDGTSGVISDGENGRRFWIELLRA